MGLWLGTIVNNKPIFTIKDKSCKSGHKIIITNTISRTMQFINFVMNVIAN